MKVNCVYKELVDINKLTPNPRNSHKHPERQIELLAKIIDHTGFRHPIVVSNRSKFIVAGHGRLMAAERLGYEKVPVDFQDFADEAEEFKFLTADNKIQELADYDEGMIIDGIKELEIDDFELLGLSDFSLMLADTFEEVKDDGSLAGAEKKYILEAEFPNDMEMMDIHDDLSSRGYIVRVK